MAKGWRLAGEYLENCNCELHGTLANMLGRFGPRLRDRDLVVDDQRALHESVAPCASAASTMSATRRRSNGFITRSNAPS